MTLSMVKIGSKKAARLFIREWIRYQGLDQRRIAERMDCKEGTVSKLLGGQMQMTTGWLASFAEALNVEIIDLYRDPEKPTREELLAKEAEVFFNVPKEKRRQAEDFLRFLARTGTDDKPQ